MRLDQHAPSAPHATKNGLTPNSGCAVRILLLIKHDLRAIAIETECHPLQVRQRSGNARVMSGRLEEHQEPSLTAAEKLPAEDAARTFRFIPLVDLAVGHTARHLLL